VVSDSQCNPDNDVRGDAPSPWTGCSTLTSPAFSSSLGFVVSRRLDLLVGPCAFSSLRLRQTSSDITDEKGNSRVNTTGALGHQRLDYSVCLSCCGNAFPLNATWVTN